MYSLVAHPLVLKTDARSLSFYVGDADKAQSALEPARQRYPAQKNWPYLEAFRGLGWLPAATPAPLTTAQETAALTPRAE